MFDNLLNLFKSEKSSSPKFIPQDSDPIQFETTEDGIQSTRRDGKLGVFWAWSDIEKIEAYKIDLYTYDEMAMRFETTAGAFEVLEGHSAFVDLITLVVDKFGAPESWYMDVMQPAFEENRTILYDKRANKSLHPNSASAPPRAASSGE